MALKCQKKCANRVAVPAVALCVIVTVSKAHQTFYLQVPCCAISFFAALSLQGPWALPGVPHGKPPEPRRSLTSP